MITAILQQPTLWNLLSQLATSRASLALLMWLMLRPTQADDNLLVHLPFDGNLSDVTNHGYDATLWGTANFANGIIGQAFNLNGYLELQDSETMLIGDHDYTVSLWMKSANIADNTPLISKGGDHCETGFAITASNQTLRFTHAFNGWCASVCEASYVINDSIWHFIAGAVSPAKKTQLYVDGQSVCNTTLPTAMSFDSDKTIKLGGNDLLPLAIDELLIYGKSLNQSEIESLYHQGCGDLRPPLPTPSQNADPQKNSGPNRNVIVAGVSIAAVTGLGLFAIKRCREQQPAYQPYEDTQAELRF